MYGVLEEPTGCSRDGGRGSGTVEVEVVMEVQVVTKAAEVRIVVVGNRMCLPTR